MQNKLQPYLQKERKHALEMFFDQNKGVYDFLKACEAILFQITQKSQKTEVYRAGIQDLLAKIDYFDMNQVVQNSECTADNFVMEDPRVLEAKLQGCIKTQKAFTASLFSQKNTSEPFHTEVAPVETSADLISTETQLTDSMGKLLLSVSDEDTFQCGKCHQWTLSLFTKQTRSGDEMATEQRYCTTCKQ